MDLLDKAVRLEQEADTFGFKWETTAQIMQQIRSECVEITEHLDQPTRQGALQEEIGDLLHAVLSLCVFCKLSPQETLQKTLNKFERRLMFVKQFAHAEGKSHLNGQPFTELMRFWDQAKAMENK